MVASAVDSDDTGGFICFGGPRVLAVLRPYKQNTVKRYNSVCRHVDLLRWQKGACWDKLHVAVASGPDVYISQFDNRGLKELYSFNAHPYSIKDIDWAPRSAVLLATCSMRDDVKIWDSRVGATTLRLRSIIGAEQAKWAPQDESIICTATGADIRLWDMRQPKFPFRMVEAHIDKVKCLAWLPRKSSRLVTTGLDRYIKFWDINDLTKPIRSVGQLEEPVSKLQFSYYDDKFFTLSKRTYGKENFSNTVRVFQTTDPMRFQAIKVKDDGIIDVCWQGTLKRRATDYLYSVSKSGQLRRYEISTLSVADSKVPLAASEDDDDLRAAESALKGESVESLAVPKERFGRPSSAESVGAERRAFKTYVRVANVGHSIGTELNFLSALKTANVQVDEINYERVIVALTYRHSPSGRKIRFFMRFQSTSPKFYKILVEIIEAESEVNEYQAAELLEMLRAYMTSHKSDGTEDTAIVSGFKLVPAFVNDLKIFGNEPIPEGAVVEGATEEEAGLSSASEKIPSTEMLTSFDEFLPMPVTCGASFNGSGFLVVFGRAGRKKDEVAKVPQMFPESPRTAKTLPRAPVRIDVEQKREDTGLWLECQDSEVTTSYSQALDQGYLGSRTSAAVASSSSSSSPDDKHDSENVEDICPTSLVSEAGRLTKDALFVGIPSPRQNWRTTDENLRGYTEALSDDNLDLSGSEDGKVLLNAPMVIIRSQYPVSSDKTGLLGDEHYVIADAQAISKIFVYDASDLLPVCKTLARQYRILGGTPLELCLNNMQVVKAAGRVDLLQIWKLVELWAVTALQRMEMRLDERSRPVGPSMTSSMFTPVDDEDFWASHPCGSLMLESLLDHYERIGDYQTAAIILCTIAPRFTAAIEPAPRRRPETPQAPRPVEVIVQVKPGSSVTFSSSNSESLEPDSELRKTLAKKAVPKFEREKKKTLASCSPGVATVLSTSAPATVAVQSPPRKFSLFGFGRKQRAPPAEVPSTSQSSSASEGPSVAAIPGLESELSKKRLEEAEENVAVERVVEEIPQPRQEQPPASNPLHRLITPAVRQRMIRFLHDYAEMLSRWKIYTKSAELMKFAENQPAIRPLAVNYNGRCCGRGCGRINCTPPRPPFYCAVCHIVVKGLMATCINCKHGGHVEHLALWFKDNVQCPTGCRCPCKRYQ